VILTFDLESGVRVMYDVGYLCANFSLPMPFFSRVRPDVRDRQTSDVRKKHRLRPPPIRVGGITTGKEMFCARGDTICPRPFPPPVDAPAPRAPPSRRNVPVVSHAQYVLTVTAAPATRVKAAVSKAAW